jgi:plasmid stabilization system protein ParE
MGASNDFKIEYAPIAYDDLDEILAYISTELQEPEAAIRLIMAIEAAILRIPAFPYKHPVARDAMLANKGYRMLTVENFAIFYLVDDERHNVGIRRILYGRRNFKWLL